MDWRPLQKIWVASLKNNLKISFFFSVPRIANTLEVRESRDSNRLASETMLITFRKTTVYSLGAIVILWNFCAESKPPVLKCSLGSSKHEKFWWQLCNLLGWVLKRAENETSMSQHENEAGTLNSL